MIIYILNISRIVFFFLKIANIFNIFQKEDIEKFCILLDNIYMNYLIN